MRQGRCSRHGTFTTIDGKCPFCTGHEPPSEHPRSPSGQVKNPQVRGGVEIIGGAIKRGVQIFRSR